MEELAVQRQIMGPDRLGFSPSTHINLESSESIQNLQEGPIPNVNQVDLVNNSDLILFHL